MNGVVLGALGFCAVIFIFIVMMKTGESSEVGSDGIMSLRGVKVDVNKKELYIEDKTYQSGDIRGIRYEKWADGSGIVYIDLNDMNRPSHKMTFTAGNAMENFLQRFSLVFGISLS
ncbi:hypothetical protein [Azospirillum sp. sgz301742]